MIFCTGPSEPNIDVIWRIFEPIVDELLLLERGVLMCIHPNRGNSGFQYVQGVLMLASNDAPMIRKMFSFPWHTSAFNLCFKCQIPKAELGDYETQFEPRTHKEHVRLGKQWLTLPNVSQKKKFAAELGSRFTYFGRLVHFDSVRFPAIDPLHVLFLGLFLNLCSRLTNAKIFTKEIFAKIQQKINSLFKPSEIGSIPHKIESGFSHLKGDQVHFHLK